MSSTLVSQSDALRGEFKDANRVGTCGEPGEGPYVRFWLLVQNGAIRNASYATPGCPSSVAAASMTVRLVQGRRVEEALKLEPKDLRLILGGLPDGRGHLADMCVEALRDALRENR